MRPMAIVYTALILSGGLCLGGFHAAAQNVTQNVTQQPIAVESARDGLAPPACPPGSGTAPMVPVALQPGIDVHGRPVAPADLPGSRAAGRQILDRLDLELDVLEDRNLRAGLEAPLALGGRWLGNRSGTQGTPILRQHHSTDGALLPCLPADSSHTPPGVSIVQ